MADTKLIQFTWRRKRHSFRAAKTSTKAQILKVREFIELAKDAESNKDDSRLQADVRRKLKLLPEWAVEKLGEVGLVEPKAKGVPPALSAFADYYVSKQVKAKPATKEIWRQGKKSLVDHFGADRTWADITIGDAKQYHDALQVEVSRQTGKKLRPGTITKRMQFARQLFNFAVDHQVLDVNPFKSIKLAAVQAAEHAEVTLTDIERVIDEAPNQDWRMIITLCRHGGLRCPSEVLSLRWQDIQWDNNVMKVSSPKTEHHDGKESRIVPLYRRVREELERSFEMAPDGAEYVISNARWRLAAKTDSGWRNCNLRTQFEKIIWRAGLKPWTRLFNSMRSSKATDLLDQRFPIHVVAAWQGDSVDTLLKHYARVKGDHILRAAGMDPEYIAEATQSDRPEKTRAES